MKNKILYYMGVSAIAFVLMSSVFTYAIAIGSEPKSSDDGYEENDDFYSAASISLGYHSGLNASDDDWYYFYADYGEVIDIDMYFSDSEGDLDISLYDSSNNLITGSYGISDSEHIYYAAYYSGDYYLYVFGPYSGQLYDLEIDLDAGLPTIDIDYTTNPDPYFEYGVNDNDEYIYNIFFDADFTASDEFYSLLDDYLINESEHDDYIELSPDFSTKAIINDLEDIVKQDFDFKILINDLYNEELNCSWTGGDWLINGENVEFPDGGYYIQNMDYFDVGIAVDLKDGDGWEGPEVIALQFLDDFEAIMIPYFEGEFLTDFQDEMDYSRDELSDPPDWDNIDPFEIVASNVEYYYQNGTEIPTGTFYLPEEFDVDVPFPEFAGVAGAPVFLPMDMNFEDYYNFLDDLLQEGRDFCDDNPSLCEWPDELSDVFDIGDMEGKVGISNIEVQSNAIGVSFNLDDVDADLIDLLEFYTELEEIGVYDFTGTVDFALEFDANWALLSMAVYIHGGLTLDWDGIAEAPIDFNEEELDLDLVFTICQDGFYPPTEEQIQNGEIGENREPSSSPFNIPSYPIAILGIIGLVSVLALVKKYRK